jgi:hypothetical protein
MIRTSVGMGTSASPFGVFLNPFAGRHRLAAAAAHVASTSSRLIAALRLGETRGGLLARTAFGVVATP